MRILIIGGTRFVGKHAAQMFIKARHDVTLFNRGNNTLPPWASEVKVITGDRKTDLAEKLKGTEYDAVIDMVLYDEQEARDVLTALSGRVKHYIMISTGSVYRVMQGPLSLPFRETDCVEDNPKVSYGYHKAWLRKSCFPHTANKAFQLLFCACLRYMGHMTIRPGNGTSYDASWTGGHSFYCLTVVLACFTVSTPAM